MESSAAAPDASDHDETIRRRLLERLAALRDPPSEPIFGCRPFAPASTCAHPPQLAGIEYCPVCHVYADEDHPALQRHPLLDPKPEPPAQPTPAGRLSRKQRREAMKAASGA